MPEPDTPGADELASFKFGGTRARPRKGIEGKTVRNETYLKPPGSCGSKWTKQGVSISVQCCEECEIFVLDVTSQVQISDCTDCRIVIGPCTGSVMLLDCIGCTVSVAAQQVRLRDCRVTELRAFAPTDESIIIETSSIVRFRAWDVAYPQLTAQFRAAGWLGVDNNWDKVYDFSPPEPGEPANWELVDDKEQAEARWSELAVAPQGLSGGAVTEVRTATPTGHPGCECPCAAADGTTYTPEGVAPDDVVLEEAVAAPRSPAAPPAAPPPPAASARPPATAQFAQGSTFWNDFVKMVLGWFGWVQPAPPAGARATDGASKSCAVQ